MNIVSFGGGTNSTAMIIGMYLHKIPIDLILFADTGGEQPHTYEFIRVFNAWLDKHGLPKITPVFYTDKDGKRYHVQLVNANFGKGDFSWTGTYDDDHHPEPGDTAKADRDLTNYIKRLYRWCDKNGVQRPKWVAATEYCTVQEDGTACGRHHHHAIIQHTDGLTRDVLEQLWADKAGQIGFTRCEYLDVDHGSVESLVRYISKNKRCARSWRQSRGLEKPKTPPPNDTKWSRKKLDEASTLYIEDVAYWERKYPGYTLNRVETRVSNAGWRHTTVIMRRAECWHGTPGRKVTPRMNR